MRLTIKKLLLVMASIMLIGSMSGVMNVAAADETFSLSIHKYYMEDTDLAGNNGTGLVPDKLPESAQALKNVPFDIYKINPQEDGLYPSGGSYTIVEIEGVLTLVDKVDSNTQYTLDATPTKVVTDEDGLATTSLPRGFYVVVEREATAPTTVDGKEVTVNPVEPFVVQLPMTNPNGDGFINDVHVYPKNEGIVIEKEVTSQTSINVGDTLSYKISGKVPAGTAEALEFIITDTLDSALDLVSSSLLVYGSDDMNTKTLINASSYAVDGNFTVSFNATGRQEVADYKYYIVEFDAVVNEEILGRIPTQGSDDKQNELYNTAEITFTNKNGDTVTKESTPTTVSTGSIHIEKVSGLLGTKLKGAEFQIASSLENAKAGKFIKRNAANEIIDADDADYASANAWVVTTDEEGVAKFEGLKEFDDNGMLSYWIVETKAPEGFYLLENPVEVTFEAESHILGVKVKNTQKGLLPQTGSRESIAMSVAGIVLMGVGFFVLINRKETEVA